LYAKLHNQRFEDASSLEAWCKHISGTEKAAVEAERASTKYMQVKFMADKVGLTFEGKVTGVMEFGIFVEMIENKCEGLIHISNLPRGYKFDAKTKQLVSHDSDEKYHLGKNINVVVKNVDVIKKQIDLEFAEEVF
jgi:ribonuclease R